MSFALVAAGLGLAGSVLSSKASSDAAGIQAQAANESAQVQREMFNTTREDLAPYRQAGVSALDRYQDILYGTNTGAQRAYDTQTSNLTGQINDINSQIARLQDTPSAVDPRVIEQNLRNRGLSQDEIQSQLPSAMNAARSESSGATNQINALIGQRTQLQNQLQGIAPPEQAGGVTGPDYTPFFQSPDYQYRLSESEKAINRGAAARGRYFSPSTVNALQQNAQGMAAGGYSDYMNRLSNLAGVGQTSSAQTGSLGAGAAQGVGNALVAAGQAGASGVVGSSNAINQGFKNVLAGYGAMNNQPQVQAPQVQAYNPLTGSQGAAQSYFPNSGTTIDWNEPKPRGAL